ncbi:carboxylating nicotinate-nucleotide diphosphorylase [Curtobacterium flaccumfaciens]|uniref:carboxylating nicotinate-nucleotide diphosphorylase n=1 Tax=Curtobacterium flaccumfaciens TaxID=2035 RepID=UPI000FFF0D78|nr:carboxylating nicotinate-nucleotide diphosphorylase [Curtobacterium flaccumfaciens]MCS0645758.1 carboxylating nicotinate-nucleotide diphosphorylase [Curtobacterium flaccumfaciens pv. flaccumfaciens]MCS6525619.1 carboxylating nicotinate-nucleotide diphosphorylase [Curtobacterium flaccumfaciens pv. flaccumfaciens]MCS6529201.1 carboxylating nicotinate-nucleotide diphosphorylase [Curtobacterium flaccumfaciens pv. flaccumfaciens]NUU10538.1 carboxylating nicotinate-nucleotide diphosphorylase [Curt
MTTDPGTIPPHALRRVIETALEEDAPWGDVTSETLIPAEATATATLGAREPGVLSGGAVFVAVMHAVDPAIHAVVHVADGTYFVAGDVLATVTGSARAVLRAERVALNLVQRMSGIATTTAAHVAAAAGTSARIVDTRKTTPGLRALERYAVRCGGGHNHRTSLSDAVLAKDNHLAVLLAGGIGIGDAIAQARQRLGHTVHVEVEVDRTDQIEPVVAAGVDTIMLDNFTPDELVTGVGIVAGRALVEASGGVSLDTVAAIAATGVDVISVGALTHSARALDLGLDIDVAVPEHVAVPVRN